MKARCLDLLIVCDLGFISRVRLKITRRLMRSYTSVQTEEQHGCPHQHNGPPGSTTYDRRSFSTPDKVHEAINASVEKQGSYQSLFTCPLSLFIFQTLLQKRFAY